MTARALVVLLLVGVSSCVQAPPISTPETAVALPQTFGGAGSGETAPGNATDRAPVTDTWWTTFGDAELSRTIAAALAQNADLMAAAARVRQVEAQARIAGADLSPSVSAGLSGSRRKQNFVGFPIPGSEDQVLSTVSSNFGVSINVSWEADLWGRLSAQAREGLLYVEANRADQAAARNSIAGQVAKAWFAANEASRQVELAERTAASFERSAQQVRNRFEAGIRSSLDVRLALAQVAVAQASRETSGRARDGVVRQLEVLLAQYPSGTFQIEQGRLEVPDEIPTGVPAELVTRRPDLVAAELRLAAAGERYAIARASLYPRLVLTGSGGTSSDALTDLLSGDFSVWSLVSNLTAPLFQGGRLRAGVDFAQAGIDEGVAVWIGTTLRAYAEVETALAAEEWLARQESYLTEAVTQSREAERQALDRYRNGLEGYVTVLEAQRRTFESERQLLTVRRLRLDNRVDLFLALGGGFDAGAEDAPEVVAPIAARSHSNSPPSNSPDPNPQERSR